MKPIYIQLATVLAALILFSSCKDENYYIVDEPDLKAQKIEAVGALFSNIARQPDMASDFIKVAEKTLYKDYSELLPLADRAVKQRGTARGGSIGTMFEAIARQPDAADQIDAAAEQFIGPYNVSYISPELNEYALVVATPLLLEALGRAPDTYDKINEMAIKYLNTEIPSVTINPIN